jgi:hypothetical protein
LDAARTAVTSRRLSVHSKLDPFFMEEEFSIFVYKKLLSLSTWDFLISG